MKDDTNFDFLSFQIECEHSSGSEVHTAGESTHEDLNSSVRFSDGCVLSDNEHSVNVHIADHSSANSYGSVDESDENECGARGDGGGGDGGRRRRRG